VDDGGLVWIKRGLACIKAASSVYQGSCVHPAGMVGVGGGWVGGSKQVGRFKAGGSLQGRWVALATPTMPSLHHHLYLLYLLTNNL
jgi:hypothetical protein